MTPSRTASGTAPHANAAQQILDNFGFMSVGSNEPCEHLEILDFGHGFIVVVVGESCRHELIQHKSYARSLGVDWATTDDWNFYYRVVAE